MALCSYWCVVNEAWCRWGAAWGDVVRAADPLCRRAFEADGGRIYHEAWCGWGAAWGDVVRAADPLCRRAFEADGGRIYHEAWCGWGAAWGDSHLGRAQSRLRARPHRASCSRHSGLINSYSRVNSLRD